MYIRQRNLEDFSDGTRQENRDIERQNSNLSSHRSNDSYLSSSGSGSYTGASSQAPEAHRFKRQVPIPENPTEQAQNAPQTGVVYQSDGSYITAPGTNSPITTGFHKNQVQTGSVDSNGSEQSVDYLRSVQNTGVYL